MSTWNGRRARPAFCFTRRVTASLPSQISQAFTQIADTLAEESVTGRLSELCDRWIYTTCLCFALDLEEQDRSGFRYHYSTYQFEYSRNLIFASGHQMSQVMEGLVDRNRVRMDMKMLKTILGRKERPHRRKGRKLADWHVTVERPSYDLTIFKLHCGKLALKIYTKGERVLRTEAMALNVEALKCGRLVEKFAVVGAATQNNSGTVS